MKNKRDKSGNNTEIATPDNEAYNVCTQATILFELLEDVFNTKK